MSSTPSSPEFDQSGSTMDWCPICWLLTCALFGNVVQGKAATQNTSRIVSRVGSCPVVTTSVCPDSKFVKFFLFTRQALSGVELDLEEGMGQDSLLKTTFNPAHPTKIAIHGWRGKASTFIHLTYAYLSIGFYNVIVVDYAKLSGHSPFCYPTTARNAPHVGRCIAQLVQRLRRTTVQGLHVFGFRLGAHIAALVARELRPYVLPRITGLDPANPLFSTAMSDDRLDLSDAVFVDVIHTSGGAQGLVWPAGHVDFYVNGGSMQPGCGNTITAYTQGCNHVGALRYFTESINTTVGFWGWTCDRYLQAFTGRCYPKLPATLMGEHTLISSRGMVQCNIGGKSPYALGPWVSEDVLLMRLE